MSSAEESKKFPINVRGKKVGLGPYLREHIAMTVEHGQDPEVDVYGGGTFELSYLERDLERFDTMLKSQDRVIFAIYELEKLRFIGSVGLREINHREGTATLGIGIGLKEFWGKGYGTEATKLVVDYGFRFLNLHNIKLDTSSFNTRAIRAYEKAGFKEIGRRREVIILGGKRYDEVLMDCLASEFVPPVPGWFTL